MTAGQAWLGALQHTFFSLRGKSAFRVYLCEALQRGAGRGDVSVPPKTHPNISVATGSFLPFIGLLRRAGCASAWQDVLWWIHLEQHLHLRGRMSCYVVGFFFSLSVCTFL